MMSRLDKATAALDFINRQLIRLFEFLFVTMSLFWGLADKDSTAAMCAAFAIYIRLLRGQK